MELTSVSRKPKLKDLTLELLLGLFSFVIPCLLLIAIFALNDIHPFGNKTIVMIDMKSQYISYIRYYKGILSGDNSLIYSLSKVFGGDFMSIFSYYLASPFNLLIAFFSYENIPDFFLFINLLKMSFAGLNMYLLLRFTLKAEKKYAFLLFSIAYALISYNIIYISNFMWLDGVMILPLVVLGILKLKEGKHYWIYTFSLGYALFSNWYIGAIICIFSVLFFIYSFFASKEKFKYKLTYIVRFGLFSLLAGGISAIIWFTAFSHLGGTKAQINFGDFKTYSIFTVICGFLENNLYSRDSICMNTGYLTMFTSIVSLVLFQLFFFNKKYSLMERILGGLLVLTYLVCSLMSPTYILMHGGREPTWFPGRYSFVIGFLVLYFGAKELNELDFTNKYSSMLPLISGIILSIFLMLKEYKITNNYTGLYDYSVVSAILYFGSALIIMFYLFYKDRKLFIKKSILSDGVILFLIVLTSISSFRCAHTSLSKLVDRTLNVSTYQKDNAYTSDFDKIKSLEEDDTYRMEATFLRPGTDNSINNNPLFYSYSGLSHYSSSEKKEIQKYMLMLGFHYNGFFEKYDSGSTAAMNSFLNIKYLLDSKESSYTKPRFIHNYPYSEITNLVSENEVKYYKNEATLPLGFISDYQNRDRVIDYDHNTNGTTHWFDHFEYQNSMYQMICNSIKDDQGKSKGIFTKLNPIKLETFGDISYKTKTDGLNYYTGKQGASIILTYDLTGVPENVNLYLCEKNYSENVSYFMNGRKIEISNYWNKGIKPIERKSSPIYELKMTLTKDINDRYIREEFYYEDTTVLKEYVEKINEQNVTNFKTVSNYGRYGFEGTFNVKKENQQVIFTIPFEEGIQIYVDGEKVETLTKMNIFTGADLKDFGLGEHKIQIVYKDQGLIKGSIVSVCSVVLIITSCLLYNKIEAKIFRKKDEDKGN